MVLFFRKEHSSFPSRQMCARRLQIVTSPGEPGRRGVQLFHGALCVGEFAWRNITAGLLLPLLFVVAACSANTIDVTRRTSLSAASRNAPFVVLLTKDQESDPAMVNDAAFLVARLEAAGLVAAPKAAYARYAVMLGRSEPRPHKDDEGSSTPADSDSGRGGMGGMGGGHGFGGGGGFGRHHGGGGGTRSGATGPQRGVVRIAIFDLTKPKRPDERVFYAEVHAPAQSLEENGGVDAMIEAALKDFPGKPRETFSEPLPAATPKDSG